MAYLLLVRHGKSEWNHLGLWTGHADVSLTEEGIEEARKAGAAIQGTPVHVAHTSLLRRTHETLDAIKQALGLGELATKRHHALNERSYGVHTGKNKWQVKEEIGEEAFQKLRRSWDEPIEEGETLKDVHARVVPYYREHVHPDLTAGNNVLIVSHGNTLRALIKHLEDLDEQAISEVEIETGQVHRYHIVDGVVIEKDIL